jgi:hypothetical protein
MTITPEVLVGFAAGLLAVLFEYVPGLSGWYDKQRDEHKRLLMLGLLVLVCAVVFAVGCAGYLDTVSCDQAGVLQLLWMLGIAIGVNQGVHRIGKRPETAEAAG